MWCQRAFAISLLNNKPIMWNMNKSLKCHRRWNVHSLACLLAYFFSRSFTLSFIQLYFQRIKAKRIAVSYLATDRPNDRPTRFHSITSVIYIWFRHTIWGDLMPCSSCCISLPLIHKNNLILSLVLSLDLNS